MKNTILRTIAILLFAALALTSCSGGTETSDAPSADPSLEPSNTPAVTVSDDPSNEPSGDASVGTLLLSVNPEIEIDYDIEGKVISLRAKNAEGRKVLEGYGDYSGKTCRQVVEDLVALIRQGGYFDIEVEGNEKNIVIKLEAESESPRGDFLEDIAEGVRDTVRGYNGKSQTMVVDRKDLNDKGLIGIEKAREIVLAQLGLTGSNAVFKDVEYELDDGVYELEFTVGNVEYEFDVDAFSGKVVKSEKEIDDDRVNQNGNNGGSTGNDSLIGVEKAKEIALSHLGLKASDVVFTQAEYDRDDGVYEIEIKVGRTEYDLEIGAISGKVIKSEKDIDD